MGKHRRSSSHYRYHSYDRSRYRYRYKPRSKSSSNSSSSSKSKRKSTYRQKYKYKHDYPPRYIFFEEYPQHVPNYRVYYTKTLSLYDSTLPLADIERTFTDLSITAGTSIPLYIIHVNNSVHIIYPSIEVAATVMSFIKGVITIHRKKYQVEYYPLKRVDLNMIYDWYCAKCEYKNYGRRNKCYRCESEMTSECKVDHSNPVGPIGSKYSKEYTAQNCSIMVRGPVIMDLEYTTLLYIFYNFTSVKDIRMIKNKLINRNKDFAFIEFYTPYDTAVAYRCANDPDFRIAGEKVLVLYSRNRSDEEHSRLLPYEPKKCVYYHRKERKYYIGDNYYKRQRQMEIEEMKSRPIITLEQLKEKKQTYLRKNMPVQREITYEQAKRKQAEQLAKQWYKEIKIQNAVMFLCPLCRRKFKNYEEMKMHETMSEIHKFRLANILVR